MKRLLLALALASALVMPLEVHSVASVHAKAHHAAPAKKPKCTKPRGYKHLRCRVVPGHGKFYIDVPATPIVLVGTGTPGTAGTELIAGKVGPPCHQGKHSWAFRLFANGPFPPLKLATRGTLYKYNPTTGTCTQVKEVTSPGVYVVVFPSR